MKRVLLLAASARSVMSSAAFAATDNNVEMHHSMAQALDSDSRSASR